LEVEITETRPVARRRELVALGEEVSVRVGLHYHRPDADRVEERALGERQIFLSAPLDAEPHEVADQHGIGVAIAAHGAGRPLQRAGGGVVEHIDGARIEIDVIGIAERWIVVGILGRPDPQPARHP
jgi:hypothetical protein